MEELSDSGEFHPHRDRPKMPGQLAAEELSEEKISDEELEQQEKDLIEQGYTIGRKVSYAEESGRKGTIVGLNKKKFGFYSADRFPLLVKFPEGTFEFSQRSIVLEDE